MRVYNISFDVSKIELTDRSRHRALINKWETQTFFNYPESQTITSIIALCYNLEFSEVYEIGKEHVLVYKLRK
jgi:hypothetical protein